MFLYGYPVFTFVHSVRLAMAVCTIGLGMAVTATHLTHTRYRAAMCFQPRPEWAGAMVDAGCQGNLGSGAHTCSGGRPLCGNHVVPFRRFERSCYIR